MSYQRALRAINLQPTDKIALHELIESPSFVHRVSDIDPFVDAPRAFAETYKRLDVDLVWPHTLPETEKVRQADGVSWGVGNLKPKTRETVQFKTSRDVVSYDPLTPWARALGLDLHSPHLVADLAEHLDRDWRWRRELMEGATLIPGAIGYTLYHWLQNTFSLELTCVAAMGYPQEFQGLLARFAEISSYVFRAWSLLPIDLLISHDDLAMQRGLVFRPEWYRENIISWYPRLWEPVRQKGIKILYWSDGDYSAVLDDILQAGADGFMIEPMISLEECVRKYAGIQFIVGNINTQILTTGSEEEVEAEVRRCYDTAGRCPGYFFCATGSITPTVPPKNADAYFRAIDHYRSRAGREQRRWGAVRPHGYIAHSHSRGGWNP